MSENELKHYDKRWCLERFYAFKDVYSRATALIQDLFKIEDEEIATLLQMYPKRWENFKKCVKVLNNWIISTYWEDLHKKGTFWEKYLTYVYEHDWLILQDKEKIREIAIDKQFIRP